MISEEAIFPKQIKIDDYAPFDQTNVLRILESSNLLLGSGARTSTAAIILAKTIHLLSQETTFQLQDRNYLEIGCGTGLLGIYLGCLGANVVMADLPAVKQLVERNINLNKKVLKGKVEFVSANWKQDKCIGKCQQLSARSSTASEAEQCLLHLLPKVHMTIVCECGGIDDFEKQLKWMGRDGMIVCFLQREYSSPQDYLAKRSLQTFLVDRDIDYDKIEDYHPDYVDSRVQIYRIFNK